MDQDSLDFDVITGLRMAGFDVLSSEDAGMKRATDEAHLTFATTERRVLYTANRADFARLHAKWVSGGIHHEGIVIRARQQLGVKSQIRALVELGSRVRPEDWADRLEYL